MSKDMCCNNCKYKLKLVKYDYSHGGCKHSDYDGFCCMAFAHEGTAIHMIGSSNSYCEMFEKGE